MGEDLKSPLSPWPLTDLNVCAFLRHVMVIIVILSLDLFCRQDAQRANSEGELSAKMWIFSEAHEVAKHTLVSVRMIGGHCFQMTICFDRGRVVKSD